MSSTKRPAPGNDLLTLQSALSRLEAIDPRGAEIVVLRFFSGLSVPEVAEHMGLSVRTVESDWTHARRVPLVIRLGAGDWV